MLPRQRFAISVHFEHHLEHSSHSVLLVTPHIRPLTVQHCATPPSDLAQRNNRAAHAAHRCSTGQGQGPHAGRAARWERTGARAAGLDVSTSSDVSQPRHNTERSGRPGALPTERRQSPTIHWNGVPLDSRCDTHSALSTKVVESTAQSGHNCLSANSPREKSQGAGNFTTWTMHNVCSSGYVRIPMFPAHCPHNLQYA